MAPVKCQSVRSITSALGEGIGKQTMEGPIQLDTHTGRKEERERDREKVSERQTEKESV